MNKFKEVYFARTGCLGHCPIYKLKIYSDGTVFYFGDFFVARRGNLQWKAEPLIIDKLNELILKYDYFSLYEKDDDDLSKCWTDMPGCNTYIIMETGERREINNDYGEDRYPDSLKRFEEEIDLILNTSSLIHSDKLNLYLFIEDNFTGVKDFHLVSAINGDDALRMLNESIYLNENYNIKFWTIINLGSFSEEALGSFGEFPFIYVSFLKIFPEADNGFAFNKGEPIEKNGSLYLIMEKDSRYNDLEYDFHLVLENSELKAIEQVKKEYPNLRNNLKSSVLKIDLINNSFIKNKIIFSKFKTIYKEKKYWFMRANFE